MKKTLTFLLTLLTISVFGQKNQEEQVLSIVAEGKLLYKSEMASWYGTDLFLERYPAKENIGGYFSYSENELAKCVFYSKSANPKVIGTISFDTTYRIEQAQVDLGERDFTGNENDLFQIRKIASEELKANKDGLFKFYQNTSPNIIPLVNGTEKKVYILTGPKKSGVVIFGNDYLLTFDQNNILLSKKQLHHNIVIVPYADETQKEVVTMHSHLPETGELITATDVCTLMLYDKFANWSSHNVVSKKYVSIWNCKTDELLILPTKTVKKINKDQEKRHPEEKDEQ
jgi:hypothetical protein